MKIAHQFIDGNKWLKKNILFGKIMAHSYTNILIHYIFSTKNREKIITNELQDRLWPYMGGIAKENNMKALAIGGIEDHVHLLISFPATLSISRAIQLIKGGSSKWVHDTFQDHKKF
ncbi:IS200/IS605 family transposase [Candidatus Latescibacterota bacterium]